MLCEKLVFPFFDFISFFPGKTRKSQQNALRQKQKSLGPGQVRVQVLVLMGVHASPLGWEWPQSRVLAP